MTATTAQSPCVEHTQRGDKDGYGKTTLSDGRCYRLHRVVYCRHHGVPLDSIQGKVIRHTCDNSRCINPEHLLVGTHDDNMRDKVVRGRCVHGEQHGRAKLSDAEVALIRSEYVARCRLNGCRALARKYKVDHTLISKIVRGLRRSGD